MVKVGFKQTTLLIFSQPQNLEGQGEGENNIPKIVRECSPLYMTINSNYRNNKIAITSHYLMTLLTARLTIEPFIY
jgi:hypothetical protein